MKQLPTSCAGNLASFTVGLLLYAVLNALMTVPLQQTTQAPVLEIQQKEAPKQHTDVNAYPSDGLQGAPCIDSLSTFDVYPTVRSLNPPVLHSVAAAKTEHYLTTGSAGPSVQCMRSYDKRKDCPDDPWRLVVGIALAVSSSAGPDNNKETNNDKNGNNINTNNAAWAGQPLIGRLIPSLQASLHPAYAYRLYITYSVKDPLWGAAMVRRQATAAVLNAVTEDSLTVKGCSTRSMVSVHWVMCEDCTDQTHRAQAMAASAAVVEGAEYVLLVEEGTALPEDPGWTPKFIDTLLRHPIPNLGVVQPKSAEETGFTALGPRHEFVHRTHVWLFGFYFPPVLTDWSAAQWLHIVYQQFEAVSEVEGFDFRVATIETKQQPMDSLARKRLLLRAIKQGKTIIEQFAAQYSDTPLRFYPQVLAALP